MGEILRFVRADIAFDEEATKALVRAYDRAIIELHGDGYPASIRTIIARKIIEFAKTGDLDPDSLCDRALAAIGMPRGGEFYQSPASNRI